MRKIFTFLGSMLLATAFTANAMETTVYISNEDGEELAYSFDANLTKDADGGYTLSNLFGYDDETANGMPISFKFNQPEEGGYSPIEITSNTAPISGWDGYYYLRTSANKSKVFWIYGLNGIDDWVRLRYSLYNVRR